MHTSAHLHTKTMKCKQVNSARISIWLLSIYNTFSNPNREQSLIRCLLWGLTSLWKVCSVKSIELDDDKLQLLIEARQAILYSYNALSSDFAVQGKALFSPRPKFHVIDETLRRCISSRLSPRQAMTLVDESICGQISKMAFQCHPLSMGRRVVDRWLLRFFVSFRLHYN